MTEDLVIGIDVGGTNMRSALVDPRGRIVLQSRTATGAWLEGRETAHRLIEECRSLRLAASGLGAAVRAAGLGVAGRIDSREGRVVFSPNLPRMNGYPLAAELRTALDVPVVMLNDADCFGIGESRLGAGRSIPNWVGLTLGTGVGGCLVLDNHLWTGDNLGFAGEIGHMIVVPGGRPCVCGSRGCLEAYASGRALIEGFLDAASPGAPVAQTERGPLEPGKVAALDVHRLARQGDPLARELFRRMGWAIGLALSNCFTVLGVRHAVIGGGVSAGWDQFEGALVESLAEHATMFEAADTIIRRGVLGDEAAPLGAALAAWRQLGRGA